MPFGCERARALLGPRRLCTPAGRASSRGGEAINLRGKEFRLVLIKLKAKSGRSEKRARGRPASVPPGRGSSAPRPLPCCPPRRGKASGRVEWPEITPNLSGAATCDQRLRCLACPLRELAVGPCVGALTWPYARTLRAVAARSPARRPAAPSVQMEMLISAHDTPKAFSCLMRDWGYCISSLPANIFLRQGKLLGFFS